MPAIAVSAVNTGTDTLTATAHGLLTGDRFRLRNVGGALPAATPALAGATDYFAIVVDANSLKVATSSANALAGTPVVDITGAGSGTTTVEYGLPYCIPTAVAAPGAQIKSANENGTWAALVALYCLLTAQAQAIWTTITVAVTVTFNALVTFGAGLAAGANQHITVSGTGQFKHGLITKVLSAVGGISSNAYGTIAGSTIIRTGASGGTYYRQIDIDANKRIITIRVRIKDAAGTTCTATLVRDVDGAQTSVATVGTSAGTAAYQTLTSATINHTVSTGGQYAIAFTFGGAAANCDLNRIEIDYDNP